MKKLIFFLLALVIASCASTKSSKTNSPAGNWDYLIAGTPEGDFKGVMTVTSADKVYNAILKSAQGDLPIVRFTFDKATKKIGGEMDYQGTPVFLDAILAGELMTGTMSAGGTNFPFTATRQK